MAGRKEVTVSHRFRMIVSMGLGEGNKQKDIVLPGKAASLFPQPCAT